MSYSSVQPIPTPRPMTDSRICPFCLRSVYSLREGKGHRYPCPCIDIERVSAPRDEVDQSGAQRLGEQRGQGPRVGADTPSVQGGGGLGPVGGAGSSAARPPEPRWQDIDNPFWVEEF